MSPRNVHVGEHEIDPIDALHRDADRFVRVLRIDDAVAEILEHERERLAKQRVVLHNHDNLAALSVRDSNHGHHSSRPPETPTTGRRSV